MIDLKLHSNGYCFVLNGKDVSAQEIKIQSYFISTSEREELLKKALDFYGSDNYHFKAIQYSIDNNLYNISLREIIEYKMNIDSSLVDSLIDIIGKGCHISTKTLLSEVLSTELHSLPCINIFECVTVVGGNNWQVTAPQSYPDTVRAIREEIRGHR